MPFINKCMYNFKIYIVCSTIIYIEIFDNVIKKIAQESKAAGAANVVKNQKNINFTTESKSTNEAKPTDTNSVIANYFANKLK